MRGLFVVLILTMPVLSVPATALAQEPLFLRIRPNPPAVATAGIDPDAEAAIARAARKAVWSRAEARPRIAIASVCTGCLKPERPVSSPPPEPAASARLDSPVARAASAEETAPPADMR